MLPPSFPSTIHVLPASHAMLWEWSTAVDSAAARLINQLEWSRRQLEEFRKMLRAEKASEADLAAANDLDKKLRAVEDQLLQPTIAEGDQKSFRGPLEVYLKLLWLQAEVGPGAADVSGNADMPPAFANRSV